MNEETRAASADLRAESTKNEQWLRRHSDLLAVAAIAAGFVIRIVSARGTYLSPDEAFYVSFADADDLIGVYLGSKATAHPPLFFLFLHLWMRLGRSEFFLRLLPTIFGIAFLWFLYRWSLRLFGRTAGFFTLLLAAFSPVVLPLSAEVRGYSLFLLLAAAGLGQFERAVESDSPARMAGSFVLVSLAILSHYAALFIVLSLAVYALFRLRSRRRSWKLFAVWAAAQVGFAFLYLFLYLSQMRALRGSDQEHEAMTGWLGSSYFRGGQGVLSFLGHQLAEVFRYFFGSPAIALVGLLAALAGVGLLAARRNPSAFLLVLPCFFGAAAGLLGWYPFGGTRHSVYLMPFVSAAMGVAFSAVAAARLWAVLAVSVVFAPLLWTASAPAGSGSLAQMNAAMEQLRRRVPAEGLLLADFRTGAVLRYYLNRNGSGNYRLVRSPLWAPDPGSFAGEVERMVRVHRLSAGQRFWVIRLGSDTDITAALSNRLPAAVSSVVGRFGDILIVEVLLGK